MVRAHLCGRKTAAPHPVFDDRGLPLLGQRLAFFTSVIGMGGSEVLVGDAMEAAHRAGAEVLCWCDPQAAIRQIVAARPALRVQFLDWPVDPQEAPAPVASPQGTAPPRVGLRRQAARLWQRLAPSGLKRLAGFFADTRRFCREIARVRPDLLFLHINGSEAMALAAGWQLRRRTVSCYHLSVVPSRGSCLDRLVDRALKTISMWSAPLVIHTSRAVRDQWCRLCFYPWRRTTVIYNGVDPLPTPCRADLRRELGLADEQFVFCVPGRLHPIKGHQYLLDALGSDPSAFANARVLVCGDGPLRAELQRACATIGLTEVVRFLGWRTDLTRILHLSDCAILPSVASENLSVAILEALMGGTPAIVTRVGGMAEAVRDGETGLVVPPASPSALREAMLRFMADRDRAQRMGEQARLDAATRFTRRRMIDEYVRLFAKVGGGCANAGSSLPTSAGNGRPFLGCPDGSRDGIIRF